MDLEMTEQVSDLSQTADHETCHTRGMLYRIAWNRNLAVVFCSRPLRGRKPFAGGGASGPAEAGYSRWLRFHAIAYYSLV